MEINCLLLIVAVFYRGLFVSGILYSLVLVLFWRLKYPRSNRGILPVNLGTVSFKNVMKVVKLWDINV